MMSFGVIYGENIGDWGSRIAGLAISCLSVLYGLSTYNLRKILRTEPNIMMTLLFTITELSTFAVIFLNLAVAWSVGMTFVKNIENEVYNYRVVYYTVFVLVITMLIAIPILGADQLSKRMLRQNNGYSSVDYRINLSLKCNELNSLTDMVRSRRRLVIVNMIYIIVTTSAMTITLYHMNMNPLDIMTCLTFEVEVLISDQWCRRMFVTLAWYTACILSFLQNTLELLYILITKKSFLDWAFKEGLKARSEEIVILAMVKEQERLNEFEEYNLLQWE